VKYLALLLLTPALFGGMVATNTTCQLGLTTATGPSQCAIAGANPLEAANAGISPLLSIVGNSLTGSITAHAVAIEPFLSGQVQSSAEGIAIFTLDTDGSARPGFVLVSANGGMRPGEDGVVLANMGVTTGPFGSVCNYHGCNNTSGLFPFLLGAEFQLTETASLRVFSDSSVGLGQASGSADVSFQFFDADGETPVDVVETPEPRSLPLTVGGLIGLLSLVVRLRQRAT
jgi:hypothetical protein